MATERKRAGSMQVVGAAGSTVPGLFWPGLPEPQTLAVLALHDQLSQSQWWRPERLETLQLMQFSMLYQHARRAVPHYRGALPEAKRIDPDFFSSLPVLTRAQVQERAAMLVAEAVPSGHGALSPVRSSGSTGRPVELKVTQLSGLFRRALYLRDHLWHGRDLTLVAATIRNFKDGSAMPPEGKLASGWGYGYHTRPMHALNIRAPVDAQLAWLERVKPAYLASFPSNVRALAEHAPARGRSLPLRQVSTYAESLPAGLRDLVRRAFGAALADIYSSEETGPIAFQCPAHEHYHVQSENLLVEVLDPAGRPCRAGEIGRVVVTDLHNFATPLIRYELGDHAEVGAPCGCGRGLPVLARILGRTRNMLRMPGGRQRWPTLPSADELGRIAPVRQFQLVQKTLREMELRLVAARPLAAEETERVRRAFLADLGGDFELRVVAVAAIERTAGWKYEDFRCELA